MVSTILRLYVSKIRPALGIQTPNGTNKNPVRRKHATKSNKIVKSYLVDDDTELVLVQQLALGFLHLLDTYVLLLHPHTDILDVAADLARFLQKLLHAATRCCVLLRQLHHICLDGLHSVLQLQLPLLHALLARLHIVYDPGHPLQQREDVQSAGLVRHTSQSQFVSHACPCNTVRTLD